MLLPNQAADQYSNLPYQDDKIKNILTMAIPLHRQLLYSPKSRLEDFGLPEDVLDKLYELYVTTKDGPIRNYYTAVDVFNEVFYIFTDIYDNLSAAEQVGEYLQSDLCIFPNKEPEIDGTSGYPKKDDVYEQYQIHSSLYVFSFVWLILEINAHMMRLLISMTGGSLTTLGAIRYRRMLSLSTKASSRRRAMKDDR